MIKTVIPVELRELILTGRRYNIPKGQIIQSTEDRKVFNLVLDGYIKRYLISNNGSLGVQVIYGPGDIFPITLAYSILFDREINEGPETYYYESMTDAQIYTIDALTLKEKVEEKPILYRDLMAIAGKRLHSTLHGLENLTLSNSYRRVAHELWYLGRQFGEANGGSVKIRLPLTHQDLADILSLTRETVSTCMVQLREKGLIKTQKNIIIVDIDKLQEEAYA